ncbi:MAG TPA: hypothetical protein VHC41_05335 [Mycobacteriales bacterium]|nr:hypothetical protein [Mycobacteriales bacterium]
MITFAAAADAAPYTNTLSVGVSSTNPSVGGAITVSGNGATAGGQVSIDAHSAVVHLATVTADSSGHYAATVTLPSSLTCSHTIVATDVTTGNTTSTPVTIGDPAACATGTSASGGGGSSGGLPFTGFAARSVAAVGIALLVGGATMLLVGRRKVKA